MSTAMLSSGYSSLALGDRQIPFRSCIRCSATNLPQNPVGHGLDQRGGPVGLKPFCETTFHLRTERHGEHFDQCIQGLIRVPKAVDLLNRVKNGGVVPTVVESSDPGRAPSPHVLGQVHGNLPTQTRGSLIPRDTSISEMIGNCGFGLFQ
jgi:hypothetical protein